MQKPKTIFVSEAIRRDSHAPLKHFKNIEVKHFYLNAPYGDMSDEDLKGSKQVKLERLLDEIVKENPQVIQSPEPFGSRLALRLAAICLKASKKTGARLIVPVLENRPINSRFNIAQRAVLWAFCPRYFKSASAVVVLNKGAIRNVKHYAKHSKIVEGIVWGVWGVDSDLFKKSGKKQAGLAVYVGRLVEEKGLKYLLEGFEKALQKLPNIQLQLIGQGSYENEMREFVRKRSLHKNVEFVGLVKNAELPRYFSRAELSIYPSITQKRWEEQVGTVNFQAMACETPALTTKSGAIPEYLEHGKGAILIQERSSSAIAKAIVDYFQNPQKTIIQKQARNFVMRYDIKGQIAKAEKLILEVAKSEK